MITSKKIAVLFSVLGVAAGTAGTIALQTHAASTDATTTATASTQHTRGTPPAAAGNVTAISGNTITLNDKKSGTTYSVDASSATIEKISAPATGSTTRPTPAAITVSGIAVGDTIMVQGTVSGTNITATKITDGAFRMGHGGFGGRRKLGTYGKVTAINGDTISLTGKDGTSYTIDASTASVKKVVSFSVSGIAVGDTLMVKGTKTGSQVPAIEITDGQLGGPGQPGTTTSPPANQ